MQLIDKVALVTGAGGAGIGPAIARRFALEGARVAIIDIDPTGANTIAKSICEAGGTAAAFTCDVVDPTAVRAVVEAVAAQYGGIDILVNNAAVRYLNSLLEQTNEEWHHTIGVNLTGPFLCSKAVIPHMLHRGKGKIVNVASVAGMFGRPKRAAYCASKGGVIALTKAVAADMRGKNINVNAVAPALIETPMNGEFANDPEISAAWGDDVLMGRWGKPSEVADAVLFLASKASDFITGTVVTVDGGWTSQMTRTGEE